MLFEMTAQKCPFLDFTGQALLSSHSLIKYHSLNLCKKKKNPKKTQKKTTEIHQNKITQTFTLLLLCMKILYSLVLLTLLCILGFCPNNDPLPNPLTSS